MKLSHSLFAIFFVFLFAPLFTYAQESAGIGITPATIDKAADPGDVIETEINVKNLSGSEQTYYILSRDIVGVRDGNAPIYAERDIERTGNEISAWLTLPEEPLVVPAGGEVVVPITVTVPENATPGDHFGGVFASVQPPKLREIGAGVGYDVASIIIVKISGSRVIDAQIREFSTEDIIHGSTDVQFNVRIQNNGSDIARPHGPLEVYNMFGSRVEALTFNDTMGGVFPGTVRDFKLYWKDENPGFGRYQATIALSYATEDGNRTINSVTSFWILPMNIIGPALGILAVLLLGSYFGVKLYVRRAVREVSGGRRLVRRKQSKQISALMLVSIVMLAVTAVFLILLLILFA